ncbi:hypothetical protein ACRCUN_23505 [Mycobacterium sp. LTG2003]
MKPLLEMEPAAERDLGHAMRSLGETAGAQLAQGVDSALSATPATSPVGQLISAAMQALHGGLASAPAFVTSQSETLGESTVASIAAVEMQDQQGGSRFGEPVAEGAPDEPGGPAEDELLDPESIDDEARQLAQQMLMEDQAAQLAGLGVQIGAQLVQQLSQQLSQFSQQLGQMVGQGGQMLGQLASNAAHDAPAAEFDTGRDWGDLDTGGDLGSGGFETGVGETLPAGFTGPAVTPTTASTVLSPTAIPTASSGVTTAASAASRLPMMPPMMPMHPMGGSASTGSGIGRDTRIFPDRRVFEPPVGVEQNFGSVPDIQTGTPPFGGAKTAN